MFVIHTNILFKHLTNRLTLGYVIFKPFEWFWKKADNSRGGSCWQRLVVARNRKSAYAWIEKVTPIPAVMVIHRAFGKRSFVHTRSRKFYIQD